MHAISCLVLLLGCAARGVPLQEPPRAVAVTTGPSESMIYLARVEGGVIAIDLGWIGAEGATRRGLAAMGERPRDVVAVFLTHSHRDHIGAWHLVRGATFHLGAEEVPRLMGRVGHRGFVPRMAALLPEVLPEPGELRIEPFAGDTAFAFGPDTVRAFSVPGHTAGSAAYLFRGVLFVGDAMTKKIFGSGYAPARPIHSDDPELAARSLEALWPRVARYGVRWVCTGHAHCVRFTSEFLAGVRSESRQAMGRTVGKRPWL